MRIVVPISPKQYVQVRKVNPFSGSLISRDIQASTLVFEDRYVNPSTWHDDQARVCAS
jgi:hypothetical protein